MNNQKNQSGVREKPTWFGRIISGSVLLGWLGVTALSGSLSYAILRPKPKPSGPCAFEVRYVGEGRLVRELLGGHYAERIVEDDAGLPGLEYEDIGGRYRAYFPTHSEVERAQREVFRKVPAGERRRANLEQMDHDNNHFITEQELTDYIGD